MATTSRSIQKRLAAQQQPFVPRPCNCMGRTCDGSFPLLLPHFPDCVNFGRSLHDLIVRTTRGIEAWAADEDGVHSDCWESYKQLKMALGESVTDKPD